MKKPEIAKSRLDMFHFSQPTIFIINMQHSVYFITLQVVRFLWNLQTENKYLEICLNCIFLQQNFGENPAQPCFLYAWFSCLFFMMFQFFRHITESLFLI